MFFFLIIRCFFKYWLQLFIVFWMTQTTVTPSFRPQNHTTLTRPTPRRFAMSPQATTTLQRQYQAQTTRYDMIWYASFGPLVSVFLNLLFIVFILTAIYHRVLNVPKWRDQQQGSRPTHLEPLPLPCHTPPLPNLLRPAIATLHQTHHPKTHTRPEQR